MVLFDDFNLFNYLGDILSFDGLLSWSRHCSSITDVGKEGLPQNGLLEWVGSSTGPIGAHGPKSP